MIDLVLPSGNENEFVAMAERLGLTGLCFCYSGKPGMIPKSAKLKLYAASRGKQSSGSCALLVSSEPEDARPALETRNIDLVFGLEGSPDRDPMKNRDSGLDHVLCSIAAQKDKIVAFDFSAVRASRGRRRAVLLGRMMQNIVLCRKAKVKMSIASFARTPMQLRNPMDLAAFGEALGMHPSEAKAAIGAVRERIILNMKKKDPAYLGEGVERM